MDWWWNLLAAMDAHEGQAAWAQGFFSVLAVAAAVWIDQGAARRQEAQLDRAELDRKRERAEVALSILGQSRFILKLAEQLLDEVAGKKSSQAAWHAYRAWEVSAALHVEVLEMLADRLPFPDLLLHTVRFVRAARPVGVKFMDATPEGEIVPRLEAMRSALLGLTACVRGMAADADYTAAFEIVST